MRENRTCGSEGGSRVTDVSLPLSCAPGERSQAPESAEMKQGVWVRGLNPNGEALVEGPVRVPVSSRIVWVVDDGCGLRDANERAKEGFCQSQYSRVGQIRSEGLLEVDQAQSLAHSLPHLCRHPQHPLADVVCFSSGNDVLQDAPTDAANLLDGLIDSGPEIVGWIARRTDAIHYGRLAAPAAVTNDSSCLYG